jgi:lauroyl/myristoyl acyltransferase
MTMSKKDIVKQVLKAVDLFLIGYFYFIRILARILPPRALYAIYSGLSYSMYYLVPGTRKRYCRTVAEALPEIDDPKRIAEIARKSYNELYRGMVDLVIFARHSERILEKLVVEGMEYVDKALATGKGIICVCAHFSGWAVGMELIASQGFEANVIVANPEKAPTPRFVKTLLDFAAGISEGGSYILTGQESTVSQAREWLDKGGILVIDIDIIGGRVVDFMGKPAAVASGIGHFVLDTGAVAVPVYPLRDPDDPTKYIGVLRDHIPFDLSGDRETDVQAILQACFAAVEKQVRLTPEQWNQWGALERWWKRARAIQEKKAKE